MEKIYFQVNECSNPNSSGDASFLTQISRDTLDRVSWDLVLLAGFVFPFYFFFVYFSFDLKQGLL